MKKIAFFALLSLLSTEVMAHSKVDATVPENGAIIAKAPAEIKFDFANKIRLTRVEISFEEQAAIPLDLSGHKGFERSFILPIEGMGVGVGTYSIEWRGLSIDGHAMRGDFSFTVQ